MNKPEFDKEKETPERAGEDPQHLYVSTHAHTHTHTHRELIECREGYWHNTRDKYRTTERPRGGKE